MLYGWISTDGYLASLFNQPQGGFPSPPKLFKIMFSNKWRVWKRALPDSSVCINHKLSVFTCG
jgi:hypothetical protein